MADLEGVARAAIFNSLRIVKGERVWIQGWYHTTHLMLCLAREAKKRGAEVLLTVQPEDFWMQSMTGGPLDSLMRLSSYQSATLETTDVFISMLGPRKPIPWDKIPKERRKEVSIWLDTRYDRSKFAAEWSAIARRRSIRMLAIEATLATLERAKAAGLNYRKWKDVMYSGCLENPRFMLARAKALLPLMTGDDEVRMISRSGTDLEFRLDGRRAEISDGLATREKAKKGFVTFLPAGGIEVSVDEESARGKLVYDRPASISGGGLEKLKLRVEEGRIDSFTVSGPRRHFQKYLDSDENAGRLSFFGFGLNSKLRFGYTQDDKVLGGVEIGFGDNERKGGKNRANGHEWWRAISKATVEIGGETIMRNGVLKPEID